MGVQADKASEPFVFEKLEIQILCLSLFVMPVRNSIFFSFFFLNYVTQGEHGPWNTSLRPLTERKQIYV